MTFVITTGDILAALAIGFWLVLYIAIKIRNRK